MFSQNQWSELAMITVNSSSFDRPLSSVFGVSDKRLAWNFEEDHDPLMPSLRVVDYRYIRLYFHPIRDKFVVFSGWKDPGWTDISAARCGIDNEERTVRERLFGPNIIDMEQKPIHQLLMDEVLHPFYIFQIASLTLWSLDEYYAYAACIAAMSVGSIVTTLIDTRTVRLKHRTPEAVSRY
jgi:cation-transporting ATPase 13A2